MLVSCTTVYLQTRRGFVTLEAVVAVVVFAGRTKMVDVVVVRVVVRVVVVVQFGVDFM